MQFKDSFQINRLITNQARCHIHIVMDLPQLIEGYRDKTKQWQKHGKETNGSEGCKQCINECTGIEQPFKS